MEIFVEVILAAILGANPLHHGHVVLAPGLLERERPVERVRIVQRYVCGQSSAVLADRELLHDMELLSMGRAE